MKKLVYIVLGFVLFFLLKYLLIPKINVSLNYIQEDVGQSKYRVVVLGKANCQYCQLYKPIIKDINSNYHLNIEFIDVIEEKNKFNELVDNGVLIPAKCNSKNADIPLTSGFGTPTTLILDKDYVTVDCMRGYVKEERALKFFKKYFTLDEK